MFGNGRQHGSYGFRDVCPQMRSVLALPGPIGPLRRFLNRPGPEPCDEVLSYSDNIADVVLVSHGQGVAPGALACIDLY